MWGNDYPHPEGTWPRSQEVAAGQFADVSDDELARDRRAATRPKVFGFDLARPRVTTHLPFVTTGSGPRARRSRSTGAPDRAPGSVRRTSIVDVVRPDGRRPGRSRSTPGRATRDDRTDGAPVSRRALRLAATLDHAPELDGDHRAIPPNPRSTQLSAARVARGLPHARRGGGARAPARRRPALPAARRPARRDARLGLRAAARRARSAPRRASATRSTIDLCSGWASGAHDHAGHRRRRGMPPMTLGPQRAGARARRRSRRLARHPGRAAAHRSAGGAASTSRFGPVLDVDAMFRDSHFDDDGRRVRRARVRACARRSTPATLVVTRIEATPRVLPYVECPAAAASAARLVGLPPRRGARPGAQGARRHVDLHAPQRPAPQPRRRPGRSSAPTREATAQS